MAKQSVIPYLTCTPAADAIGFYAKAFGATETLRMPAEDGKRLLHAELALAGGRLFLGDAFPEHCGPDAPQAGAMYPVAVALDLPAPAEVDRLFASAVAAGATGVAEPADAFWGARFAMLVDPFGHRWMLNAELPKA